MEQRNEKISFFKSIYPNKLTVSLAESLNDQIRFYLDNTLYIAAIESEDGCSVSLCKESNEESEKTANTSKISFIKENFKSLIKPFAVTIGLLLLEFIAICYLCFTLSNILVLVILVDITLLITSIIQTIILEFMATNSSIRSKHSAEHMMVNFLEANKRLPRSIQEVRKASRFSPKCGTRKGLKKDAEHIILIILTTIFTTIISTFVFHFSSDSIANEFIVIYTYFIVQFITRKVLTKYGILSSIINRIEKVLSNIAQCANTTSKVEDKDIILAYSAARFWLFIVYPEFYNQNDDPFWNRHLKVVSTGCKENQNILWKKILKVNI